MPRVPVLYYICISSMPHLQSCNILLTVQPYKTHEIYMLLSNYALVNFDLGFQNKQHVCTLGPMCLFQDYICTNLVLLE
jgi:hypothetical protein